MGANLTFNDNDDVQLKGATDGTLIGNVSDAIKTSTAVTSSALPTGAATAALQTTGNSSLSSIDAGIPNALGAATTANSMPVNIASDQTVPVSAASLPLPSGAATAANQSTEITSLQLIDDIPHAQNAALVKGVPMMGQLDDTSTTAATEDNVATVRITAQRAAHVNLRNNAGTEIGTSTTPVRVDPTGTTTQPVITTNASVIKAQLQDNAGTAVTLGQKTMASSLPVVIASDQTAIPASQSGTWTVRNQDGSGNSLASSTTTPTGTEQSLIVRNIPSGTQTVSGTVTANQGTANTIANGWPVKLTDGTDTALVTTNGDVNVADISNNSGSTGAITIGTSALIAAANGTSNLTNRKYLSVYNNGSVTIYWGTSNAVTTSTGTPIVKNQQITFAVGTGTSIFLISGTASQNVRIVELA